MWIRRVVQEFLEKPYQRNIFTKKSSLYLKTIYIILVIIMRLFSTDPRLYLLTIIFNMIILLWIRAYRSVLLTLFIWVSTLSVILAIDYLAGTLTIDVLVNILHSYATITSFLILYLTTPSHQLRDLLGFNVLVFSYTLIRSFLIEALEIIDSLDSRGYEIKYNILRYVNIMYIFMRNIDNRASILEEALRARGLE